MHSMLLLTTHCVSTSWGEVRPGGQEEYTPTSEVFRDYGGVYYCEVGVCPVM